MLTILQNDQDVPIGSYGEYLSTAGIESRLVMAFAGESLPDPSSCSAVIALGGAMGVHDEGRHPFLRQVKRFIAGCVRMDVPFLGICLGGQLLADVLGARVSSGICCERGVLPVHLNPEGSSDPLFSGIPNPFLSFQWHNDSFDLPQGAVTLASSPACPQQAFRFGRAYGLQFHPEVNSDIIANWCREIPGDPPMTEVEAGELLYDFTCRQDAYYSVSHRLLENFLGISCNSLLP